MSGFEIVDNVDAVKALFEEKCNKERNPHTAEEKHHGNIRTVPEIGT